MRNESIRVLLIEDNPGDAYLIRKALTEARNLEITLVCEDRLARGIERLASGRHDLVLLDLSLPDSQGLETFNRLCEVDDEIPIIILTGFQDERVAVRAVQGGAEDYLVKGEIGSSSLVRAIRYALERHRTQGVLRAVSMLDGLTGLYNRRGFVALVDQQCRLAERARTPCSLLLLGLYNRRPQTATLGDGLGDAARLEVAELLAGMFRRSDIIARLQANDFASFLINCTEKHMHGVLGRLERDLNALNAGQNGKFELAFNIRMSFYDPERPSSLSELLGRAEASGNKKAVAQSSSSGHNGVASPGD
ncbi:MAG TPA: diguanylate cyclase response regulator [Terriglobia bacterium]|jgi:diguanylate cyclase (GGDEF)-like protein|nr:diguanylate cyclase response regulator [Terriglobia bacterium]